MTKSRKKVLIAFLALTLVFTTSVIFAQAETSGANGSTKKSTSQAETSTSASVAKKSLAKAEIVLSKRQVRATGSPVNPTVKSVTLKNTVIPKSSYVVKYYTNGGKEVEDIVKAGRYNIVIKAKKSSKYKGEVSCPYTVLGLQQKIAIEETRIKLKLPETIESNGSNGSNFSNGSNGSTSKTAPAYTLKPTSNGDGTGFGFKSYDKSVVKVNKNGEIFAVGKGSTKIKINTKGNVIFHPARIYIYVEVI